MSFDPNFLNAWLVLNVNNNVAFKRLEKIKYVQYFKIANLS